MNMKPWIMEFIKDKRVGAIASTSKGLANKLIENIDFEKKLITVEYGPGHGAISRKLLEKMTNDSVVFVFETNTTFVKKLKEIKDNRLIVINDDASNAKSVLKNKYNVEYVDYIISTIPFTFIEKHARSRIMYDSYKMLKQNGMFITYQYSFLIYGLLKRYFNNANWDVVIFNLPPVVIFNGIKDNRNYSTGHIFQNELHDN